MSRQPRRRMLLGLTEISGYWARLEQGLHDLGVAADLVTLEPHPYDYADSGRKWPLLVRALRALRSRPSRVAPIGRLAEIPLRAALLVTCLIRYDTFVFGYHATFFQTRDLWLLRLLGKEVVTVFHGSDERPPWMDGYLDPMTDEQLVAASRRQAAVVQRCDRHSTLVVSNPNSGHLHRRRSLVYHVLGNPVSVSLDPTPAAPGSAHNRTIRFLHAPSNPRAKGTPLVRSAIEAVRADGIDIELIEVQGLSNRELHSAIASCDAVIDQAFGDCPWAMLAAEAAMLGRPAIIGGYGHAHLRQFIAEDRFPPALYCEPDELADAIRRLALDGDHRIELAEAARRFAPQWAPQEVARRLLQALEGTAPEEWYFDPADITYLWGGGLAQTETRRRVRAVVSSVGTSGLGIDGHPALRSSVVEASNPT